LRQTLLFSALQTVSYNLNRRQKNLKLFEFGKGYYRKDGQYKEESRLALILTGNFSGESWVTASREVTFHDLASAVSNVLTVMRTGKVSVKALESAAYTR